MSMLMTSILAAALLAQSPDAIVLSGVVVDADEKPVSGVDVVLPAKVVGWIASHAGSNDDK